MKTLNNIEFCKTSAEWDVVKLGDENIKPIILIRNGLTTEQSNEKGDFKVTRIETISDGFINENDIGFVSNIDATTRDEYLIKKGDILFSHINSEIQLGKAAIAERDYKDLLHGMNLLLFRANEEVLLPEFLFYVFNYFRDIGIFVAICSRAVNQASINQGRLKKLEIPLPSLEIQRTIVNNLSKIEAKINIHREIIANSNELKEVMLHHLITGKAKVNG